MKTFKTKLITPVFVALVSLLVCFAPLDPNGKENLLLALVSGYFGNLASDLSNQKDDDGKDNGNQRKLL